MTSMRNPLANPVVFGVAPHSFVSFVCLLPLIRPDRKDACEKNDQIAGHG